MNSFKPIKFLLVDDLEANLIALEALLVRDDLELLKAKSGQEALELLLVHDIALAFVDVQMPGMSGFELAEIMRSTERTRRTPIIFLTAGTVDHERRIRGYETGAIDFLPKPIDPSILLNKADVFFELAVQRRSLQERERELRDSNDKLAWINAELAGADKKKDEFLAMLGHELRNPLAPLLTGIEILLTSPGNPAMVEEIGGIMKRQIGQMAHLIDDLLDVSRINHGKISLRKDSVSMEAVINQALETVQTLMAAARHELKIIGPDEPLTLEADYHRLTQVVSNLLSNAAKYTPPGGKIVLQVSRLDEDRVRISVKDNGKGISPEHQAGIFDLFDQGAAGPRDGLGIGLTLVKSLVEMHGGTIRVASGGEGQGSEFIVEVPGLQPPVEPSIPAPVQIDAAEKRYVLVADDGKATADILGMFFRMEGMECQVVYDGAQAIAAAEASPPHLICLDLGMPVLDGYQTATRLREICPGAYIVALSGWGSDDDRRRTKEAGFDEHLVKPVNPDDLRSLLTRVG
jgi:signal transduction histidine kinase